MPCCCGSQEVDALCVLFCTVEYIHVMRHALL
jgi:hypothetical protein